MELHVLLPSQECLLGLHQGTALLLGLADAEPHGGGCGGGSLCFALLHSALAPSEWVTVGNLLSLTAQFPLPVPRASLSASTKSHRDQMGSHGKAGTGPFLGCRFRSSGHGWAGSEEMVGAGNGSGFPRKVREPRPAHFRLLLGLSGHDTPTALSHLPSAQATEPAH